MQTLGPNSARYINARLLELYEHGGGVCRLSRGVYDIEEQIVLYPGTALIGEGRDETILRAAFSPSSSRADDATNSLITSYSPVAGISTTLAAKVYRGDWRIQPTATPSAAWIAKYLRIKGHNTLGDEYLTSDEDNTVMCDIVRVASVSSPYFIPSGRARVHLSAGLPVQEVAPLIGSAVEALTVDAVDAGTIATGIELRHAIDCRIHDVAFAGFTRSDWGIFHGGHGNRVTKTHRLGGSNAHGMVEAVHNVVVDGVTCDPNGERFHPTLGVKRQLLTFWGDCDGYEIRNCKLEHAGGALLIQAGHGGVVDHLHVRDMHIDPVHDALASTGEGAGAHASTGVVAIGNSGGTNWPANLIAGRFDNILVEECFSEYAVVAGKAACYAMVFHDCYHGFASNWTISYTGSKANQSEAPLAGGTNYLRGLLCQDVIGRIRDLHVRGLAVAIDLGGNYNPDIIGHTALGANGAGASEGNGAYWMGIDMADPMASSGPLFRDMTVDYAEGGYYGIVNGFRPPPTTRYENFFFLFRSSFATWMINKSGGDVEAGQAVALDEAGTQVIAGYPQVKAATAAASDVVVVAVFGERSNQNSDGDAMVFARLIGDVGVKVRSADAVRPGDKLVVDSTVVGGLTGRDWKKDNAASSGYVVATAAKSAGARAIVQAVRP